MSPELALPGSESEGPPVILWVRSRIGGTGRNGWCRSAAGPCELAATVGPAGMAVAVGAAIAAIAMKAAADVVILWIGRVMACFLSSATGTRWSRSRL